LLARGVAVANYAVGYAALRPGAQRRHLPLELAREEEVVAVEVLEEVAARLQPPALAREPGTAVRAPHRAHLGVRARERLDDARRVVGRSVVDDDDLDRP